MKIDVEVLGLFAALGEPVTPHRHHMMHLQPLTGTT